ncbi:MAG: hypothetical protein LBF08_01495 [Dysgonamonadaceae bacterium]|jgi:hypothetical protein|nr:hypothetical protein [Dysgonamonadaceae bacterium]
MKEKVNIQEKTAEFLLKLALLVIGGVIFTSLTANENIDPTALQWGAIVTTIGLISLGFSFYHMFNKKKITLCFYLFFTQ